MSKEYEGDCVEVYMGSKEREDQKQMEYLRAWQAEKEREQQEKLERKCIRNMHMSFAWSYMKAVVEELLLFFRN